MRNLKTMRKKNPKRARRLRRAIGIKKRISGTAECPRVCIFRSARHMSVQAIDDTKAVTLAAASTLSLKDIDSLKKTEQSQKIGEAIAEVLKKAGVSKAVCDRNGFRYHGRVQALVEGMRTAGIQI